MYTAEVVVFHLPDLKYIPYEIKPKNQIWVAWSLESEINWPCMKRPALMRLFDLKMTYRLDSEVPYTYLEDKYEKSLRSRPVQKKGLINAFISSPFNQSRRVQYLRELMKYIELDSFGKVYNNKKIKEDNGGLTKEGLIPAYKFTIAFENSISKDYVTEKFFQPLAAGSVPIYLGAPNIDDFAPGRKCFINVRDFKSPKDLALYITKLDKDDEAYNEYFKWKTKPFTEKFNTFILVSQEHPFIRLCKKLDVILCKGSFF